jgi:hypothetical protein
MREGGQGRKKGEEKEDEEEGKRQSKTNQLMKPRSAIVSLPPTSHSCLLRTPSRTVKTRSTSFL